MAWRMVIELVMAIVIGGAMGWGLDTLFGTMPLFLVVFVLFGLAAGVRMMLQTAAAMNRGPAGGPEHDRSATDQPARPARRGHEPGGGERNGGGG